MSEPERQIQQNYHKEPFALRTYIRDLRLKIWEWVVLVLASIVVVVTATCLVGNISLRRIFSPVAGEGALGRPIGKVILAVNKTVRQSKSNSDFSPLHVGDAVYPLDTLMAGADSALKVRLKDGGVIELGANSMVKLSFSTGLQALTGQPVVDVIAGTVHGKEGGHRSLKIRSANHTYTARRGHGVELSKPTAKVALHKTAPALPQRIPLPADPATQMRFLNDLFNTVEGKKPQEAPKVAMVERPERHIIKPKKLKPKVELVRISDVKPQDNFEIRPDRGLKRWDFPVVFSWNSSQDNAVFKVSFFGIDRSAQVVRIKANDGKVKFRYVFLRPGQYVWKIADAHGHRLAVRRLHFPSKIQVIDLASPVLFRRSNILQKLDNLGLGPGENGFRFIWKPVPGVKTYRVKVTRASGQVILDKKMNATSYLFPLPKILEKERLHVIISAKHAGGFTLVSRNAEVYYNFMAPVLIFPKDGMTIQASSLPDNQLMFKWDAWNDVKHFHIQVASDRDFKDTLVDDHTDDHTYQYYLPPDINHYYWRVRGRAAKELTPMSPVHEFWVK